MVTLNSDGRPLFCYWNYVKISGLVGEPKNMISVDIWYMAMDQCFLNSILRMNIQNSPLWCELQGFKVLISSFFLSFPKSNGWGSTSSKIHGIFHETIRGDFTSPWTARVFLLRICVQYTAGNLAISKRWNWSQLLSILSSYIWHMYIYILYIYVYIYIYTPINI